MLVVFDVDWSPILELLAKKCGSEETHLVCLVVVLRIILEDVCFLFVVECLDKFICAKLFSPLFIGNEPGMSVRKIKTHRHTFVGQLEH